jgi:hypothetical protein
MDSLSRIGYCLSRPATCRGKSKNGIIGHKGFGNLKYDSIHVSGGSSSMRTNLPLRRPMDPLLSLSSYHNGEGGNRMKWSQDANLQHGHCCSCHHCVLKKGNSSQQGLAYVCTLEMRMYQRIMQEMGDSYRLQCEMYYCCHVTTTGKNYVNINVVVAILSLILILVISGMFAWGIDKCLKIVYLSRPP